MNHLLHSGLIWYLSRGTGVVLVALLTLSTALGVLATRGGSTRWPRFALQSLHRNVSLLACALLLGHAATPVIDTYVNHYAPIAAADAVVPFVSAYKPLALGLGTLAFDVIVAVVLTSVFRHRMGYRTWFGVHLLTYASWALGVVHGLLIGTDAWTIWSLAVTGTSVAVVLAAVVVRVLGRRAPQPARLLAPEPDLRLDADPVTRRSRRPAPEAFVPSTPETFIPTAPEAFIPAEAGLPADPFVAAGNRPLTRRARREAERRLDERPLDAAEWPAAVQTEAVNRHRHRRTSA